MDDRASRQISRRTALQRGAIIGAGVWAVPVVSSIRLPAAAQVGSPKPAPTTPEPSPSPSVSPTEPSPTPTPPPTTRTEPSPTASPEVRGVTHVRPEVGGRLAETGQNLGAQAAAGAGLGAIGAALRTIARKRSPDEPATDDPSSET